MSFSIVSIIFMLFGSGGGMNELLDVADPKFYFEAERVEYTVDSMIEVLGEPVTKDFAEVKSQEVRKLMAMRALGKMKDKSALPALQKVAESKALFFDDYAAEAIAAIEGKDHAAPPVAAADLKKDQALLADGIGLVVQARLVGGDGIDMQKMIGESFKGQEGAPKPEELMGQINSGLGKIFKEIGNVRVDAVTIGLSADVGNDGGFVVIIARGKYDHRAFESFVSRQSQTKSHQIGGTMFLGLGGDSAALAPVSDELLIFVSGPKWEKFPLENVAAKLKAPPADPDFSEALQKVIARADQSGVVWGAGLISAGMKELPPLASFDEIVLSTTELKEKAQSRITVDLVGSDPKAITASIDQMRQQVQDGVAEMEQQSMPAMASMLQIMKSLNFDSMGLNGSISATVDGGPSGLIGMLLSRIKFGGA